MTSPDQALDNDARGELVHLVFEQLCVQMRGTPNRPIRDKHGWDSHLTLPRTATAGDALEHRETERRVMVQVKSCTPKDWAVSVRLSNAERMAKEKIPWFLFIGRFPVNSNVVSEYFVVHFDEARIGSVLKRLRELDREGTPASNTVDIEIPFTDVDRIADSNELEGVLRAAIERSEPEYIHTKSEWIANVGFKKHRYTGSFELEGSSERDILRAARQLSHRHHSAPG